MKGGTAADLVRRARDGDRDAWAGLVERYLGLVHAVCRALLPDGHDAAAVNRVVWLRLAEHLPGMQAPEAVGGWIAGVTRSECLRARRAAGLVAHPGDEVGLGGGGPYGAGSYGAGPKAEAGRRAEGAAAAGVAPAVAPVPSSAAVGADDALASAGEGSDAGAWRDLLAAFAVLDAPGQRLLGLLAADPRPSDDEVGAALDLPPGGVAPARERSLADLRAAVIAGADR